MKPLKKMSTGNGAAPKGRGAAAVGGQLGSVSVTDRLLGMPPLTTSGDGFILADRVDVVQGPGSAKSGGAAARAQGASILPSRQVNSRTICFDM